MDDYKDYTFREALGRTYTIMDEHKDKLDRIKKLLVTAIYIYRPSFGRDLWSLKLTWKILREVETDEFVEELVNDPAKVYKELYGDE